MKLIYKKYLIEDDRNGFILYVLGEKGEDSKFEGEEYIKEQFYPATLEKCFERIFKIEKISIKEEFEIKEYLEKIKELQSEMIKEIQTLKLK